MIPIKTESSSNSYDRSLFRYESDIDRNRYWTRAEVLQRDSLTETKIDDTGDRINIISGRWLSMYDNKSHLLAKAVQIDHLVPLKEAWESGAVGWSAVRLKAYGNDLSSPSLVVVTISLNQIKGYQDFYEWKPPTNVCWYAQQWIAVKYRWNLAMDNLESEALERALSGDCGSTKVELLPRP